MIRVNLLQPKLEATALADHFILPFYKEIRSRYNWFMTLKISRTIVTDHYSLSKNITFLKEN